MRIAVLTTSYPRSPDDAAGRFLAVAHERLRAAGIEIEVCSPASFRHFGLAYGSGVMGNLRKRPWLVLALPAMLISFWLAARRAARDADLVHAHWLPTGLVAVALGKPLVLQAHGTDVELARRAPWLARALIRRAAAVICVSRPLADAVRRLGATDVRVIPHGFDVPEAVAEEAEPPEVLFAGRLSREKGLPELLEAAKGLPLVVVGDGPLADRVPDALGFVSTAELDRLYGRAAVLACPSRREGFGVVCAEAMAHGRPVVASAVGGLLDLVVDGETGVLVPPGDVTALRKALERLLADPDLRARMGAAARERIRAHFSAEAATRATIELYEEVLRRTT